MGNQAHWDEVYRTKEHDAVSWYAPRLSTSFSLIQRVTSGNKSASIIDIGAGQATLVDELLADGFSDLNALDISGEAIAKSKHRLGPAHERVGWYCGDITTASLPAHRFDVWHDRAVFHFLTLAQHRSRYVAQTCDAVRPGGHLVLATFGPDGPLQCSGLPVVRYDSTQLASVFKDAFELTDSALENHTTPAGKTQQFLYAVLRRL